MIYILKGTDVKKRSLFLKNIVAGRDSVRIENKDISKELLKEYAQSSNLFGDSPVIVVENMLTDGQVEFSVKELPLFENSKTMFIFLEDKLKAADQKKYTKYATIESFEDKKSIQPPKINTFAIVDSFARHDKVGTWILYREAIEKGIEPEMISGLLFWKIKSMILGGTKLFTSTELKNQSSQLVSLYHRSHRGESDFIIGLEQFILTSLTK